jgi:hypothetical protein
MMKNNQKILYSFQPLLLVTDDKEYIIYQEKNHAI